LALRWRPMLKDVLHHIVSETVAAQRRSVGKNLLNELLCLRERTVLDQTLDNAAPKLVPRDLGHGALQLVQDKLKLLWHHDCYQLLQYVVRMG